MGRGRAPWWRQTVRPQPPQHLTKAKPEAMPHTAQSGWRRPPDPATPDAPIPTATLPPPIRPPIRPAGAPAADVLAPPPSPVPSPCGASGYASAARLRSRSQHTSSRSASCSCGRESGAAGAALHHPGFSCSLEPEGRRSCARSWAGGGPRQPAHRGPPEEPLDELLREADAPGVPPGLADGPPRERVERHRRHLPARCAGAGLGAGEGREEAGYGERRGVSLPAVRRRGAVRRRRRAGGRPRRASADVGEAVLEPVHRAEVHGLGHVGPEGEPRVVGRREGDDDVPRALGEADAADAVGAAEAGREHQVEAAEGARVLRGAGRVVWERGSAGVSGGGERRARGAGGERRRGSGGGGGGARVRVSARACANRSGTDSRRTFSNFTTSSPGIPYHCGGTGRRETNQRLARPLRSGALDAENQGRGATRRRRRRAIFAWPQWW